MKKRIILTIFVVAVWYSASVLWGAFESPIRGIATANQLSDSSAAYAVAKFLRDGHIGRLSTILFGWVAASIWLWPSEKQTIK